MKTKEIHIGNIVKDYVLKHNINTSELARKIGKTRQNLYDFYKREDVEVKLLLTISEVLNHDFFDDIKPTRKDADIDKIFDVLKEVIKERM